MSSVQAGLQAIASEPSNRPIVLNFIRFAIATAVVPILVYFIVFGLLNYIISPEILPKSLSPPIISGIAAVLALNIVTGSFALLAVKEQSPPSYNLEQNSSEIDHEDEIENEAEEDRVDESETTEVTEEEKKDQ